MSEIRNDKFSFSNEQSTITVANPQERIQKAYLDTPILKLSIRNMDQTTKTRILKTGDDIYLEARESEHEILEVWREINKSLEVHLWNNKKKLSIHAKLSSELLLKSLNIKDSSAFANLQQLTIMIESTGRLMSNGFDGFFCHFIIYLTQLRHLSLSFYGCDLLTDGNFKVLGSTVGHHLAKLTSFHLFVLHSNSITDRGLKSLLSPICRYLNKLQEVALAFPLCSRITNKGVKTTGSLIGNHLTALQRLQIYFAYSNDISDDGMTNLVLNISKKLTNLRYLKLLFSENNDIKDKGLQMLRECIIQYLSNLQILKLNFSGCRKITDTGFESVASSLNSLTLLKHLDLDFSNCTKVTEKGLKSLNLKYLSLLNSLTLNFGGYGSISNQCFKEVLSSIFSCPFQLQLFHLNLFWCTKVNDEILELITTEFNSSLANLTSLTLFFTGCSNVTNKGFEMITLGAIRYLKQLKDINLYFYSSPVTQECKSKAKTSLNSISNVSIS